MGFFKDLKQFRADRASRQEHEEYYRWRPPRSATARGQWAQHSGDPLGCHQDAGGAILPSSAAVHVDGNTTLFIPSRDWPEIRDRINRVVSGGSGECEKH